MRRLVVALGLMAAIAVPLHADAAIIVGSWPVGRAPFALAADSTTGKVYVANSESVGIDGSGRISVVDPATGSVTNLTTTLTANFVLVDAASRRLYSSNATLSASQSSVDAFDLDTGVRLASMSGVGGLALALDASAGRLYAAGSSLTVIDTESFGVVGAIPGQSGSPWFGVAVHPGRDQLWLTSFSSSPHVSVFQASTLAPLGAIATPTNLRYAITVDAGRDLIFAAGSGTSTSPDPYLFYVFDAAGLSLLHTTTLAGFPTGLALSEGRIHVPVIATNGANGGIHTIDDQTFEVAATDELSFPPSQPLMHSDGRLYVARYDTPAGGGSTLYALELGNHAPIIDSVSLTPAAPKTIDVLTVDATAHDPDLRASASGQTVTFSYAWSRNGEPIAGATGKTLDLSQPGVGDRGDVISVEVTASDGQLSATATTSIVVANTEPRVSVSLSNATPKTNEVLTATAAGSDVDDDTLTYTYTWRVNGVVRRTATSQSRSDQFDLKPKGNGDRGDQVSVTVTASDSLATSPSATATATVR
jgi:hypothetical protein